MNMPIHVWSLMIVPALVSGHTEGVLGYVGPAGLGALGVLLLVVAVLMIGALGLVLHPIRLILRRRRRLREEQGGATQDAVSPQSLNETS